MSMVNSARKRLRTFERHLTRSALPSVVKEDLPFLERFNLETLCHEKTTVLCWDNMSTAHWYQNTLMVLSDAALDGFWV